MYIFKPSYIIIHHSLTKDSKTVSWQPIRKYHLSLGWQNIGYHYGIEMINHEKYEILAGRMEGTTGAHTKGLNEVSIGICLVGNFDKNPPNMWQWKILLKLCKNICLRYAISADKVKGHREYASHKSCPGNAFDMIKFRKDLEIELIQ
jgi:N-acetylmuramoyl-L-alanine amidase